MKAFDATVLRYRFLVPRRRVRLPNEKFEMGPILNQKLDSPSKFRPVRSAWGPLFRSPIGQKNPLEAHDPFGATKTPCLREATRQVAVTPEQRVLTGRSSSWSF